MMDFFKDDYSTSERMRSFVHKPGWDWPHTVSYIAIVMAIIVSWVLVINILEEFYDWCLSILS